MDAKQDEPKHTGVLMRAANGDLWVLVDDSNAPVKLDEKAVDSLKPLLPTEQTEQVFTFPLPQQVITALEKELDIGPLFWCWVFCSASRLR